MSTPTRIGLSAVILAPLLLVGSLLALVSRQPAPSVGQFDAVAFNRAIAEGDAHLAAGDFEAASASYSLAVEANPRSPAPAVKLGNVLLAQGEVK